MRPRRGGFGFAPGAGGCRMRLSWGCGRLGGRRTRCAAAGGVEKRAMHLLDGPDPGRRGFTLIELLVVIAII
ncbi:MAG: type II secretion system protein, partial [Phycisphaerales bacterium]|nr:type II secretion system protein [Phycisphaerales bacterium]